MDFQRYAIYYTPPHGPLADFGAAWLGWDIATGLPVQHPIVHGLNDDIAELTQTPRKYGFHGTIKPPFRLAPAATAQALAEKTEALCNDQKPITLDGLQLSKLGCFLALTISGDASPLANIAAKIVRELDSFRAQPTETELAKRRKANLSPQQEHYLLEWGYPYVLDEFRFHLTLTGRLEKNRTEALQEILGPILQSALPTPFRVDDLTLAGEDASGRFHEIERFKLAGEA